MYAFNHVYQIVMMSLLHQLLDYSLIFSLLEKDFLRLKIFDSNRFCNYFEDLYNAIN